MTVRRLLPLLLFLSGAVVVVLLVRSVGIDAVVQAVRRVLPYVPLLTLPYLAQYLLEAAGWYFAFGAKKPKLSFFRLFALRMAGEAVNNVTPFGYMGGEPVKAMLLARNGIPMAEGLSSVVVAKTLMTVAQALFVLAGLGTAVALSGQNATFAGTVLLIVALVGLGLAIFIALQRQGLFRAALALLDRLGGSSRISPERRARLLEIDALLSGFHRERRADFALCLSFYLAGWLCGVPEVLLMLSALGSRTSLAEALAIESLASVVKGAAFIVPGSLGAQEAGIVGLLGLFGQAAATSVPFSLLRRAREILWNAFGLTSLAWHARQTA